MITTTCPVPDAAFVRRLRLILAVLIAAIVFAVGAILVMSAAKRSPIPVQQGKHSWLRHGEIADYVHNACQDNGPEEIWKIRNTDRFVQGCRLPDGRYGVQIFHKVKDLWEEITSFIPEKGGQNSLQVVRDYLIKSNATPFKSPLP